MFLSNFIRSKQSFYLALSHISIRKRNKIYAGVLIIRSCNHYPRGWAALQGKISSKKVSQKSHIPENRLTAPNTILIHYQKHTLP